MQNHKRSARGGEHSRVGESLKLGLVKNLFLQFVQKKHMDKFYPNGWEYDKELRQQILAAYEYVSGFYYNIFSWKEYVEKEDRVLDPTVAYEIMYLTKSHNPFMALNWQYLVSIEKSAITSYRSSALLRECATTRDQAFQCWHLEHKVYDMVSHCVYLIYSMVEPKGEHSPGEIGLNAMQMQTACISAASKTELFEPVEDYIKKVLSGEKRSVKVGDVPVPRYEI